MLHFNKEGRSHISLDLLVLSLQCDKNSSLCRRCYCMLQQNANAKHFSKCTKSAKFHSTITKYY